MCVTAWTTVYVKTFQYLCVNSVETIEIEGENHVSACHGCIQKMRKTYNHLVLTRASLHDNKHQTFKQTKIEKPMDLTGTAIRSNCL